MKSIPKFVLAVFVALVFPKVVFCQELTYDAYAPKFREPLKSSSVKEIANNFLTYPLELARWPIDKSLVYIEKHHMEDKALWLYETSMDHGVTPHLGIFSLTSPSVGAEFDFVRLVQQKDVLPNMIARAWIDYSGSNYFGTGAEGGWKNILNSPISYQTFITYEDRHQEHFHGLGPDSSLGEGSVFEMEQTKVGSKLNFSPNPVYSADFSIDYKNVNISGGKDGGRGQVGANPFFTADKVPGLNGDELFDLEFDIARDTRDHGSNSKSGGRQRISLSYNEGLYSSKARYLKYVFEANKYLKVGSERRVVALNFYGEHNDELNNGYVPFHQMARLGGFGSTPHLSHTLRAYDFDRFFDESQAVANIEYRYTVWEYRALKGDAVLFWDEGQVFGEFSKFQFSDFRESYGLGFRVSLADITIFTVEMAHGDEGTNFYVKTSAPF